MPRRLLQLSSRCWVLFALIVTGCDSVEFVPSPPAELREPITTAAPAAIENPRTNGVELIVKRRGNSEDMEMMLSAVRLQAGYDKLRLKTSTPEELVTKETSGAKSAPTAQAALIRKAMARHPQAMILEVEDTADREITAAVNETRAAGIIVVIAGAAPAGLDPADAAAASAGAPKLAPLIVVGPVSFAQSAIDLVKSAMRNAGNAGIKDRNAAVILRTPTADNLAEKRAAAIESALKAAKITEIQQEQVTPDVATTQKRLVKLLQSNPKIGLVFSVDVNSSTVVAQTLDELIPQRPFVAAAYTWESSQVKSIAFGQFAAVAEYNPLRTLRRAITAAAAALQRGETPKTVDTPLVTQDSPPETKLSQSETILAKPAAAAK